MRIIDDNLPEDVEQAFFSDQFWYASSKERATVDHSKPLVVGCGDTLQDAIDDMRDLKTRYVPHKQRASTWKYADRFSARSQDAQPK